MKKLMTCLILATLTTACGKGNNQPGEVEGNQQNAQGSRAIYGSWDSGKPMLSIAQNGSDPGVEVFITVKFEPNTITNTATCKYTNGTVLTSEASVPAKITDKTVVITSSSTKSVASGDLNCSVSISPMTYSYTITNKQLTLTKPGEPSKAPLVLIRQ